MTDYDNRKENQAFEHVELLQRQRESAKRAESDHKPAAANQWPVGQRTARPLL